VRTIRMGDTKKKWGWKREGEMRTAVQIHYTVQYISIPCV
jgi:hypothetical protein